MKPSVLVCAAAVAAMMSACQSVPDQTVSLAPYALSDAETERMQEAVAYGFRDPGSAQFRSVKAGVSQAGIVTVCGEVNAKNGFGGYAGFTPFIGDLTPDGFALSVEPGQNSLGPRVAAYMCAQRGLL